MSENRCPFIWLLGENEATTANNNAFYFWQYITAQRDDIAAYFVLTDTAAHRKLVRTLPAEEQSRVLWKNSYRHLKFYRAADLFLVSFSVRDILPDRLFGRKIRFRLKKPLVYLQHGTTAIKKLGYTGDSYGNHLLRFMVYNPLIADEIVQENGFAPYQLHFAAFHPRYQEMARRLLSQQEAGQELRGILWFVTWREYFSDTETVRAFLQTVRAVLTDKRLAAYLTERQEQLTLCIHHLFDKAAGEEILALQKEVAPLVRIVRQSDCDVMALLQQNRLLITDYSSVGFDFSFLGRPVVLFLPDIDRYLEKREIYCRPEELMQGACFTPEELVLRLLGESSGVLPFYRRRLPRDIPYADIADGVYQQRMYAALGEMQRRRVVLFGVDYGAKRSENAAALRLAEWLLSRGYRAELQSLKTRPGGQPLPCGLTHNAFYDESARVPWQRLRRIGKARLANTDETVAPYALRALRRSFCRCRCADAIVTAPALLPLTAAADAPGVGRLWTVCPQQGEEMSLPTVTERCSGENLQTTADWERAFPPLTEGRIGNREGEKR